MCAETLTKIDVAVNNQIADLIVNLNLARRFRNQNPNWKTSEGVSISEIIKTYEFELGEARKCLSQA